MKTENEFAGLNGPSYLQKLLKRFFWIKKSNVVHTLHKRDPDIGSRLNNVPKQISVFANICNYSDDWRGKFSLQIFIIITRIYIPSLIYIVNCFLKCIIPYRNINFQKRSNFIFEIRPK